MNGPNTLTVHINKETGVKIYVFGERHESDNDCDTPDSINIDNYLLDVFEKSKVPIDFYLEST